MYGDYVTLHVFDWLSDGRLLVDGLEGDIQRVALLSDRGTNLDFERPGPDVEIRLPPAVPDSRDHVILVECKQRPRGDGAILLQTNMPNTLCVFNAELLGGSDHARPTASRAAASSSLNEPCW